MPARAHTVATREQAQATLARSMAALAVALDIPEPAPLPYDGKDVAWNQARELARIAAFVETAAKRVGVRLSAATRLEEERDAAREEHNKAVKERDQLRDRVAALSKPAPTPAKKANP